MYSYTDKSQVGQFDDVDGALFSRISTKDSGSDTQSVSTKDIVADIHSYTDKSQNGQLDDVDGALFSRISTKDSGRDTHHSETTNKDGADIHSVSIKDSGADIHSVSIKDSGADIHSVSIKDSGADIHSVSIKDSGADIHSLTFEQFDDVDGALFSRISTNDSRRDIHTLSTKDSGADIHSLTFEQIHDVDGAMFSRISTEEIGAGEKERVISDCHCCYSKLQSRKSSIGQGKTRSDKDDINDIHNGNIKSYPKCNTVECPLFSNRSAPCNINTHCLDLLPKTRQTVTQEVTPLPQKAVVTELSSMLGSDPCPLDSCVHMQSECHNNSYPKISESRTEIVEHDTVELQNMNIKQPIFSIDSTSSFCEDDCNWAVEHADSNRNESRDYVEGPEPTGLEKENLLNSIPVLQSTQSYINQKEQVRKSSDIPSQGKSECYLNEYDVKTGRDLTESRNIGLPSQRSSMFYLDEDNTDTEQHSSRGKKVIKRLNNNTTGETTSYNSLKNLSTERSSTGYGRDSTGAKCPIDTGCVALDNSTKRLLPPKIPADHSEILHEPKTVKSEKRHKRVIWHVARALTFPMISVCVYFWDIGSDIRLAIAYRDNDDTNLFWITMACIIVPLILMSLVDVSWLWLDRPPGKPSHVIRYVIGVLTLGRIARALQYMWHLFKSNTVSDERKLAWHKKRATEEGRDCYILDFINAFAESAPQLFVQMYLMYAYNLELTVVRTLNLLSSWISIAWTYAAYYRCNREAVTGTQDLNIISFTIFFFSVLSALAVRVICIVIFLVTFKIWIGAILLSVHLVTMLLWIILKEKPKLEGTASSVVGKCLYYIFFAYVSLLCFLNLRDTPAKHRMTAFYILLYIENCIMAVVSFYRMNVSETGNERIYDLLVLPIGFSLHMSLLVAYYHLCHPKTGMCSK